MRSPRRDFSDVVVNLSYKGRMIESTLGTGSRYGLNIAYSREGRKPLDSGGAVAHARRLLGDEPFAVVNGDVFTDFPLATLRSRRVDAAHLVLVPSPPHNVDGDFGLEDGRVCNDAETRLTYAGIAVYHPMLADGASARRFSIVPALRKAAEQHRVTGERFDGLWIDVGTEERLAAARAAAPRLDR